MSIELCLSTGTTPKVEQHSDVDSMTAPLSTLPRSNAAKIIGVCLLVTVLQNLTYMILAPFVPGSAVGDAIGDFMVGFVIAAYPLGVVLSIAVPPIIINEIGLRASICAGIIINSSSIMLIGLTGQNYEYLNDAVLSITLVSLRLIAGAASQLSWTASFVLISDAGVRNISQILAFVEVAVGVGVGSGAVLGGLLYEYGGGMGTGAFFTPCLVASIALCLLIVLVWTTCPSSCVPTSTCGTQTREMGEQFWNRGRLMILLSVMMGWGAFSMNAPIMAPYLLGRFGLGSSNAGLVLGCRDGAYMLIGLVVGYLVDGKPEVSQWVMTCGWYMMVPALLLLGPVAVHIAPLSGVVLGQILLGTAASAIAIPSLPELQRGVQDSTMKARIASLWSGVFSMGAVIAPVVASAVDAHSGFNAATLVFVALSCIMAVLMTVHVFRPGLGGVSARRLSYVVVSV